ncbi:MAG: hypothetical protein MUP81_06360 [Dehalococcoidia bacterium]|nr:hypothetical protein [Dehalococcoidia bacterium]
MSIGEKKIQILIEAIIEAERFIKRAKAAKKDLESDECYSSSKEVAAAKRASMDLSRILTKVRH